MHKEVPLKLIRIDGGTQQRPICEDTLSRYVALMKDGTEFPPLAVVHDGKDYWLWDGFHRYHALRKIGKIGAQCAVDTGTKRDAVWFSYNANSVHGMPRQEGVAKKIITDILKDEEWSKLSQREIAKWVNVSQPYVNKIAQEFGSGQDKSKAITSYHQKPSGDSKNKGDVNLGKQNQPEIEAEDELEPEEIEPPKPAKDMEGKEIPSHLVGIFSRSNELKAMIAQINEILRTVKDGQAKNDPLFAYIKMGALETEAGNVKRQLKFAIPWAVCRYCGGVDSSGCRACDGLGFANELRFKTTAEELK